MQSSFAACRNHPFQYINVELTTNYSVFDIIVRTSALFPKHNLKQFIYLVQLNRQYFHFCFNPMKKSIKETNRSVNLVITNSLKKLVNTLCSHFLLEGGA